MFQPIPPVVLPRLPLAAARLRSMSRNNIYNVIFQLYNNIIHPNRLKYDILYSKFEMSYLSIQTSPTDEQYFVQMEK